MAIELYENDQDEEDLIDTIKKIIKNHKKKYETESFYQN